MVIYSSMKQYKVALFIGRFQPFHNGHLYSLRKGFEMAEKVVVGIGSSQESETENNPFDFETRKRMIESLSEPGSLPGVSLPAQAGRKVEVVAIPDMFNDEKWGNLILTIISDEGVAISDVVGVGNNDWTNRILKKLGMEVFETGLYNRDELEGVKIRELRRLNDEQWKKRVPESVVKCLEEYDKQK